MKREEQKICACSSCQCRYRVAEALEGKIVCCKKCGARFKVSFEVAGGQEESAQKASDRAFDLTVSEDNLEAYICPRGEVPDGISLDSIKALLEIKGIKYGIVDDRLIDAYLKKRPIRTKPWRIAQGQMPEPPRDASIKYYFDIKPLKIGTVKKGGAVDFKDRGEIPQVKKGALLAEKIPGWEGIPGIDVFGDTIGVPKPKDIKLICGKGAETSEDKLKAFAKLDGRPEISFDGKMLVLPQLRISGDVGLETGHIGFDGNIEVYGSVQDGFRVTGRRLSADEILRAEIDIAGDIVVLGGIIGARIKTGGAIKARYIRAAEIEALGDVVVDKEVIDSRIESNGACLIKTGKMLSSWVSAKRGIEADEIGSEASKPCTLVVGFTKSTRSEVDRIEEQIERWKDEQKRHKGLMDELEQEYAKMDKEIGELAQVQDSSMVQHRAIVEKMEKLRSAKDRAGLKKAEKVIDDLNSKIKQTEETLNKLLGKRDRLVEIINGLQNEIKNCEEEISGFEYEIEALSKLSQREKGRPAVKVHGTIFSHTTIRGPHTSIALKENFDRICIRETKIPAPDSTFIWDMNISRLE